MICKSDIKAIGRLLLSCSRIIDAHCTKANELDKARLCRKMIKKLNKKGLL